MKKIKLLALLLAWLVMGFCVHAQERLPLYSKAPDFTATDQYGKTIQLNEMLLKGHVVLTFYRGEWCPHCNRQMSNLQDSLEMITALGATVVAITPEQNENIAETMLKTHAKFSIVYDENHKIMDLYKVTFKLGGAKNMVYGLAGININKASGNSDRVLPVPATYIIDTSGRIIGSHFNTDYSRRMPVSEILNILNVRNRNLKNK